MGILSEHGEKMVDCREMVDKVKHEASIESLADKNVHVELPKIVLDKDGKVCDVCTDLQAEFAKNPGGLPPTRAGLIIAGIVGGAGIAITTICVPFVLPALRAVCLPYVPATTTQLGNVTKEWLFGSWGGAEQVAGVLLQVECLEIWYEGAGHLCQAGPVEVRH